MNEMKTLTNVDLEMVQGGFTSKWDFKGDKMHLETTFKAKNYKENVAPEYAASLRANVKSQFGKNADIAYKLPSAGNTVIYTITGVANTKKNQDLIQSVSGQLQGGGKGCEDEYGM